jgi:CxxC motif-containing protein (DUF1111 family)
MVAVGFWAYSATATEDDAAKKAEKAAQVQKVDGAELFNREWLPNDARAAKGDGLGPVFNETSCVACHNQGAVGGGGPSSKNVDVISVFANPQHHIQHGPSTLPEAMFRAMFGGFGSGPQVADVPASKPAANDPKALAKKQREELAKIHPGFTSARSVVLHKSGTDPEYDAWRLSMKGQGHLVFQSAAFSPDGSTFAVETVGPVPSPAVTAAVAEVAIEGTAKTLTVEQPLQPPTDTKAEPPTQEAAAQAARNQLAQQMIQQHRSAVQQFTSATQGTQAQIGNFTFLGSQRNPTALFGAGIIDAIPEEAIKANAGKRHKDFPEVQGRVARLKDGKIGRFGWKNQTASLYEFAMTACAVELGLDVPDHPQAGVPHKADYKSPGNDMTKEESDALVNYLKNLPAPVQRTAANKQEAEYLATGEEKFAAVGCATCHVKDVGDAKGVFSDLLLHDMGQDLGDTGSYGIFIPNSAEEGGDEPIPSLQQQQIFPGVAGGGKADREKTIGALRQEWRTPPLWGVRDSAPYLHDGRADTLEQAIALHGGEAARSAQRFFELKPEERMKVMAFLKSLRAPETQVASR